MRGSENSYTSWLSRVREYRRADAERSTGSSARPARQQDQRVEAGEAYVSRGGNISVTNSGVAASDHHGRCLVRGGIHHLSTQPLTYACLARCKERRIKQRPSTRSGEALSA